MYILKKYHLITILYGGKWADLATQGRLINKAGASIILAALFLVNSCRLFFIDVQKICEETPLPRIFMKNNRKKSRIFSFSHFNRVLKLRIRFHVFKGKMIIRLHFRHFEKEC